MLNLNKVAMILFRKANAHLDFSIEASSLDPFVLCNSNTAF